jgi:PAS domain S-box-containing protein
MPDLYTGSDTGFVRRFNLKNVIYALIVTVAILWIRVMLQPMLGPRAVFTPFFPVIIGIAWWLGFWPASFAVLIFAYGAAAYLFDADRPFEMMSSAAQIQLWANVSVLILCAAISDLARQAKMRVTRQIGDLRAGEALLQTVTRNARVGLVIIDAAAYRYVSANDAYAEMLGVKASELPGKRLEDVLGPVYADARARIDRALAGERISFEQVLPARGLDGSDRVLYVTYEMRDDLMQGNCLIAVVLDITQHRAAERALIESQDRLRTLASVVEHSLDFVGVSSTDMEVIFVNDAGLRMLGLKDMRDAQRHRVIDYFHPDDRARVEAEAIPALQRDGTWKGDVRFRNFSTGETIHTIWNVFAIRDEKGKVAAFATISPNLNELRLAEMTLREKRARTQLLNETLTHLLTSEEPENMVRDLFPRVASSLKLDVYLNYVLEVGGQRLRLHSAGGLTEEQTRAFSVLEMGQAMCGKSAQTLLPVVETKLQQSTDPRAAALKSIGLDAYVCHPMLVGERLIGTLSFGSRSLGEFGVDEINFLRTITQYVAIALDRAAHNRALSESGEALRASEARLMEADRRKDEFIALLAHELRNPLGPIRNGLAVLNSDVPREQATRALATIERQTVHMTKLVDDLLDVARVKNGKLNLTMRRVELVEVVGKSIEDHRSTLEQDGRRIELEFAQEPLWVRGDDTRISQIVENLLTNACKFTGDDGTITISLKKSGDRAVLKVIDTGIGMEPGTISRLFEPFSQADASLDRSRGGLGLGLALVKGLVDSHAAEIAVHSDGLGKGCTFTISFPLIAPPETAAPANSPAESRAQTARRVLIIEDNLDAAESMRMYLEISGHEIHLAHNGSAGLQAARRLQLDAIICDIGLPGEMDGYGVARALRREAQFENTCLIALSGYGQEEDRRRAREAGFDLHITKPADPEQLNQLLQGVTVSR